MSRESRALLSDTLDADKIGLKSELEFLRSLAEILEPLDGGPGDVRRALYAISTMRMVLSKAPRSEIAPFMEALGSVLRAQGFADYDVATIRADLTAELRSLGER